jgi:hypothetical protein
MSLGRFLCINIKYMYSSSFGNDSCELEVQVLTQAHWPQFPESSLILPPRLAFAVDQFSKFYKVCFMFYFSISILFH